MNYIADNGMIFTPRVNKNGDITAKEVYEEWLTQQTPPTLEQRTTALESAVLAMLGGASNV